MIRSAAPSPTDDAPASKKKPCLRDLRSLKEEYESIIDLSYGDDSTSTESMNLLSFDITITDEDYPVKQKKRKRSLAPARKKASKGMCRS